MIVKKKSLILIVFFLWMFLFSYGCVFDSQEVSLQTNVQTEKLSKSEDRFQIYIFEFNEFSKLDDPIFIDAASGNDLSVINNDDLGRANLIINEDDILFYNWNTQEIALNDVFREKYLTEQPFLSDFSIFILTFQGRPLFSGKILTTMSPLYVESPVLYISSPIGNEEREKLIVYLRPQGTVFRDGSELGVEFPFGDETIREQVRQYLLSIGKLSE